MCVCVYMYMYSPVSLFFVFGLAAGTTLYLSFDFVTLRVYTQLNTYLASIHIYNI